jgi:hypothetical protein
VGPNGNAVVTFAIGTTITFATTGQILSSTIATSGAEEVLVPVGALLLLISSALAAFLLGIGIVALCGQLSSLRPLKTYAAVKIPVGIATGIVVAAYIHVVTPRAEPAIPLGIVLSCLGIIFPIGLLLVSRSRVARDVFDPEVKR